MTKLDTVFYNYEELCDWSKIQNFAQFSNCTIQYSYKLIEFLDNQYGMEKTKYVLEQTGKLRSFDEAFKSEIGMTPEEFYGQWLGSINKAK